MKKYLAEIRKADKKVSHTDGIFVELWRKLGKYGENFGGIGGLAIK